MTQQVPKGGSGGVVWFSIKDPFHPPDLSDILEGSKRRVRIKSLKGDDTAPMAYYPLSVLLASLLPGNFLRYHTDAKQPELAERFELLKRKIKQKGIRTPLMLEVDRSGRCVLGEGNHRLRALVELHSDNDVLVPVRFVYNESPHIKVPGLTWNTQMDRVRKATLDAKQRGLAKRLIDFRQKLLQQTENSKPPRQMMQNMKGMDNALTLLRNVARQLRRYDNAMFNDVIDVIKSLQGDLSAKR